MATIPIKQQSMTRPRFDDFHQADDMRITSYALRYMINPPEARCPTSFPVDVTTRIQQSGDGWVAGQWRTDVESDLKGINRVGIRNKCDDKLYDPKTNNMNNNNNTIRTSTLFIDFAAIDMCGFQHHIQIFEQGRTVRICDNSNIWTRPDSSDL
jgi:hypothetical protein